MIIISPNSRSLHQGLNPKTYPYWQEVVRELVANGQDVIQIGYVGENPIKGTTLFLGRKIEDVIATAKICTTWASVDNFFPHLCAHIPKYGVVVWSRSDPLIFGYKENINLIKDRAYLRSDQFGAWNGCPYVPEAFIDYSIVVQAILSKCN